MSDVSTSRYAGWGVFVAVILFLTGAFSLLQGVVALVGSNVYYVVAHGSLFLFDLTGWGWWNLIFGALLILAGIALLLGQTWARVVAIILAILSALGQLFLVPAQPVWALIVIALDVWIIYVLTAHGKEIARSH